MLALSNLWCYHQPLYMRFCISLLISLFSFLSLTPTTIHARGASVCLEHKQPICSIDQLYTKQIHLKNTSQPKIDPTPTKSPLVSILPSPSPTKPSPKPTITPLPTPSTVPTLIKPTLSPSTAPTLEPTSTAVPTPIPSTTDDLDTSKILTLINQHRQSKGLAPLASDDRLCNIASDRRPQLQNEMFGSGYIHQGFNSLALDYWITENMVHQPSEEAALAWWLRSSLHRSAIESASHTHSCGICQGHTCIQLFTSWQPK